MKIKLILEFIGRYFLGLVMIAYGLIKIFEIQFRLTPDVYDIPLHDLDGVTLAWAFLGYTPWFTILLGIFEFIPGVLLLFSRTRLMGKILLLPFLVGIFLVNNALGFLPYMKIFTGFLLLLDILLLSIHYDFLKMLIQKAIFGRPKNPKAELLINLILISAVTFLIIYYLL